MSLKIGMVSKLGLSSAWLAIAAMVPPLALSSELENKDFGVFEEDTPEPPPLEIFNPTHVVLGGAYIYRGSCGSGMRPVKALSKTLAVSAGVPVCGKKYQAAADRFGGYEIVRSSNMVPIEPRPAQFQATHLTLAGANVYFGNCKDGFRPVKITTTNIPSGVAASICGGKYKVVYDRDFDYAIVRKSSVVEIPGPQE